MLVLKRFDLTLRHRISLFSMKPSERRKTSDPMLRRNAVGYVFGALLLLPAPALANTAPDRAELLEFIETNQLDSNLYNLLAATIPRTEAGQIVYEACGSRKTEDMFENGYSHIRQTMGDVWRAALADIYVKHLTSDDLAQLSALEGSARQIAIAEALTAEPVVEDLRQGLSSLIEEATARHINHMLDEAETLCKDEQ